MTSNERDALVKRINCKLAKRGLKLKSVNGVGRIISTFNNSVDEEGVDIEALGIKLGVLKTAAPEDIPIPSPVSVVEQAVAEMLPSQAAQHEVPAPESPASPEPEQDYSNSVVSKHSWHTPIPADEPAPEPVTAPVLSAELTTEELLARAAALVAAAKPEAKQRKPRGAAIVIGGVYGVWTVKEALGHSRFSCAEGRNVVATKTLYAAELRAL